MAGETVLKLTGVGVAPYSARGLTQSLTPIEAAASMRRTINGALVDLGSPVFKKYGSTISGNDQKPPCLDGIWPGHLVTVECIYELCYPLGGTPQRPAVPESAYEDGGYIYYRPVLQMRVMSWSADQDEWAAASRWSIQLEEV